jgi:hypothetical protein
MISRTVAAGVLAAGALAAAVLALAGCSGDSGTVPASPTAAATPAPAATTPTEAAGAPTSTSPPAPVAGEPGVLPAGFPVPPGTRVGKVSVEGGEITATLTVTDGKTGYDFWRSHLPPAGYRITGSQLVGGIGEISFSGRDCAGPSQLGINDDSVSFECKRG